MNEPVLTLTGNAASDVRYVETDGGATIASFRLASTPRRYDRASRKWVDQETIYLSVTCWRFLADNVAKSVRRGDAVVVSGRLRIRSWEKDGRSGTNLEITADAVGHDLNRGQAAFAKVTRTRTISPDDDPETRSDLALDESFESGAAGLAADLPGQTPAAEQQAA